MKNLYDYERTQSATTDLPFGALKNESSPGKQDGTDIVAEHIQDLAYSLYQVLQLAGINPNGELEDGNNKTQFIESLTNIGVFRYSDKTSYNYGVFAWQVIGNTFTLYRSLKNSNSDDVNNNESWLKILEIGADNKINFNVDTNILGLSANPSLSNLSEAGEDRLNVSKMYETGAVSNDTKGFEELLKRAHSTFDKSKFTIEGSTSITNDGIASGFSNADCILLKEIDFSDCNTWNYIIKINTNSFSKMQYLGGFGNSANFGMSLNINTNATLSLNLSSNGTAWNLANNLKSSLKILANTDYYIRRSFDGANYKVDVSTDNKSWTNYITLNSTSKINPVNLKPCIGNFSGLSNPINGSIDLKSIAIWAGGVPVFNGNKTGLYVAKPDNYEKVGDVVVSDDGFASGFSTSNFVKTPEISELNKVSKSIRFTSSFIYNTIIAEQTIWNKNLNFDFRLVNGDILLRTYDGSKSNSFTISKAQHKVADNEKMFCDVIITSNLLSVEINGIKFTKEQLTDLSYLSSSSKDFRIGMSNTLELYYRTSIDLNAFKIYVDGNLVYQPCLKIPYTEAFEHPNVVDVAYRNRVQDLYEQTGESLFYTIDEQNQDFTLPAGDIYGMITKNREILDIVYPIGRPMPEENNVLLDKEVWLEGATVNIVDYPKLFKIYGTKYGGDGTTTFKLPDMRNRVLWGSSDGSNGYIEAKLPNIKGAFFADCGGQGASANGAFAVDAGYTMHGRGTDNSPHATYSINASRSSSIYSDDATTVQPPAFKVRWKTRFE